MEYVWDTPYYLQGSIKYEVCMVPDKASPVSESQNFAAATNLSREAAWNHKFLKSDKVNTTYSAKQN